MSKFIVDGKVFENNPTLAIGVIVAKGINNCNVIDLNNEFRVITDAIKAKFSDIELSEYPVIRGWRNLYKSFGEKKNRSSIEALIRRIINGKELSFINPLVDIYNLISLKYEMPCGGEDLDCILADMELTYSNGEELFIPLGSEIEERPNVGEIIYKFGNNVICRSFNYRESDLTKLTNKTVNAVLVIENLNTNIEDLNVALQELSDMVNKYLGGSNKIAVLDKDNNEIDL